MSRVASKIGGVVSDPEQARANPLRNIEAKTGSSISGMRTAVSAAGHDLNPSTGDLP
jgi:hypothetical protein